MFIEQIQQSLDSAWAYSPSYGKPLSVPLPRSISRTARRFPPGAPSPGTSSRRQPPEYRTLRTQRPT